MAQECSISTLPPAERVTTGDNAHMTTLRIANSQEPARPLANRTRRRPPARRASGPRRRTGADEHARRRRCWTVRWRRSAVRPVPAELELAMQRGEAGPRGASAEGTCRCSWSRASAAGDPRPRRPRRRLRQRPLRRDRRLPQGRASAPSVAAPAGAIARAASGPRAAGPARQRQHAAGQASMPATTTPSCWALRGLQQRLGFDGCIRAVAGCAGLVAGAGAGRDRDRMPRRR